MVLFWILQACGKLLVEPRRLLRGAIGRFEFRNVKDVLPFRHVHLQTMVVCHA